MSDIDKKIDDMFGLLHEMKPVLIDVREGQKAMDARMRDSEVRSERHAVKIERLESDIDGLGRKVRNHTGGISQPRGESPGGKWLSFLEIFAVLPQYWHVALSIGMGAVTVFTVLISVWRHKP